MQGVWVSQVSNSQRTLPVRRCLVKLQ